MKVLHLAVVLGVLSVTQCLPAPQNESKVPEQVDFVPLEENAGPSFTGVVDVGAGDDFFGNPFGQNPFPNLFSSLEEIMNRMRQQLGQILGRLPERPEDSPFPELHIPKLGDIDLGKGNTTSVTKIIDGHKVTINETEYKQDGNGSASFFKVRIIDVHPDGENTEVPTSGDAEIVPPKKTDTESMENNLSNEIPNIKSNEELTLDNIETFDDADLVPPFKQNAQRSAEWDNLRSVETIEDNSIDTVPQPIYDLSHDIYVNKLLADAGAPTNPDAEVFDPNQAFPQHAGIRYEEPVRTPYYRTPVFNLPPGYDMPVELHPREHYSQPEPFPYPSYPYDNRFAPAMQAQREFENLERIKTNNIFPRHQNALFDNQDLHKAEKHKNKKTITEFLNPQSSLASQPSVPLTQQNLPNPNVPATSS